ncbi:helix-turn-helix domain-containing protein [Acetoanaerobium noterae]|uniref:helix-turn-helix domain-containing protein n=1 Tax=Acetoanaerobium noterae TaxID=745369 RepID=UPI00331FCA1A
MSIEEMIANTVKEVLVELLEELKPKSNAKEVMNAKEVGQYLNMSESWVRQEKMNGLPHFYLGNKLLFNKEDIDKWRLSKTAQQCSVRRTKL